MATTSVGMSLPSLRVGVIDDVPLVRVGIATALSDVDGVRMTAAADHHDAFLSGVKPTAVDVVLVEPWGRAAGGTMALTALREGFPDAHIIALSSVICPDRVQACLECGIRGYIDKALNPVDLPSLIRQAHNGQMITPVTAGGGSGHRLTPRELEVLRHVAEGISNADAAQALFVTEQTVKFHLGNIYRKLNVHNRTEAVRAALRDGLIT